MIDGWPRSVYGQTKREAAEQLEELKAQHHRKCDLSKKTATLAEFLDQRFEEVGKQPLDRFSQHPRLSVRDMRRHSLADTIREIDHCRKTSITLSRSLPSKVIFGRSVAWSAPDE